jgi:hypothetical protein
MMDVDEKRRLVRGLLREVGRGFAEPQALSAARKLGLGRTPEDLAELAEYEESEQFGWLVGALAQIDLDHRHEEIRALAGR